MHNNHMIKKETEELERKALSAKENSLFGKIQAEIESVKIQENTYRSKLAKRKQQIKACIDSVEVLLQVIDSKLARQVIGLNEEQAKYIEELLEPTGGGVTDYVLPQYLGSIEDRVLQLLQIHEAKIDHEEKKKQSRPGSKISRNSSRNLRCVFHLCCCCCVCVVSVLCLCCVCVVSVLCLCCFYIVSTFFLCYCFCVVVSVLYMPCLAAMPYAFYTHASSLTSCVCCA